MRIATTRHGALCLKACTVCRRTEHYTLKSRLQSISIDGALLYSTPLYWKGAARSEKVATRRSVGLCFCCCQVILSWILRCVIQHLRSRAIHGSNLPFVNQVRIIRRPHLAHGAEPRIDPCGRQVEGTGSKLLSYQHRQLFSRSAGPMRDWDIPEPGIPPG